MNFTTNSIIIILLAKSIVPAIIFIVYLIFFSWLITRIPFFKNSALSRWWLIGLFMLKIIAGLTYAWFYTQPQYYTNSDTWRFYHESLKETDGLMQNPSAFLKDIFTSGYNENSNLFLGENSYWNDLKSNVVIKLMAIFNVFTFKNYYANIILFNFLFFFGPVALYRLAAAMLLVNRLLLVCTVFCIPSFLFWCSGAHKDGLIFSCIAMMMYQFNEQLKIHKFHLSNTIIFLLSFFFLFTMRNFMAILLVPAFITWYLCNRYRSKKTLTISVVYGLCIAFFFIAPLLHKSLDFPAYVVMKQNEFKQLSGNSQIAVPELEPSFISFIKFLPTAIDIGFLRPHLTEIRNKSYLPAVAELIVLWILIIYILGKRFFLRTANNLADLEHCFPFLIFSFCFSISVLLLSGYTITFSGSIVRYRSVVLPLLIMPLLALINSRKVKHIKNNSI